MHLTLNRFVIVIRTKVHLNSPNTMDVILDPIPYHFLLCFIYFFFGGGGGIKLLFWVVGWRELNWGSHQPKIDLKLLSLAKLLETFKILHSLYSHWSQLMTCNLKGAWQVFELFNWSIWSIVPFYYFPDWVGGWVGSCVISI